MARKKADELILEFTRFIIDGDFASDYEDEMGHIKAGVDMASVRQSRFSCVPRRP